MSPPTLRVAVVGAGHMGRLHMEKLSEIALQEGGAELVGVADTHPERCGALAAEFGGRAETDFRELISDADAFIVAVPTVKHFDVARELLASDRDVLLEKPIAATLAEAEALVELAAGHERVLQVGHLEWFNGAMQAATDRIHDPRFIEAQRVGPFPARATDVDVVRDLMIHDLDILQQLLGEEPESIEAVGVPVVTSRIDVANARVHYPSGCVASLTASRVAPRARRRIRFFQKEGYLSVDLLERSVSFTRAAPRDDGRGAVIGIDEIAVEPVDALRAQLCAFLRSVRTREPAAVDGESGLGALRTALRVVAAMPNSETPIVS